MQIAELATSGLGGDLAGVVLRQVGQLSQLETLLISCPYKVASTPLLPHIIRSCTRLISLSVKACLGAKNLQIVLFFKCITFE